jgi:GDP-L-fucose synthase
MNLPEDKLDATLADGQSFPIVNIGCGNDVTVRGVAELIAEVVGFSGSLVFDTSKPDGTPRKLLEISRLTGLGWRPSTRLREGLVITYKDFLEQKLSTTVGSALSSGD